MLTYLDKKNFQHGILKAETFTSF